MSEAHCRGPGTILASRLVSERDISIRNDSSDRSSMYIAQVKAWKVPFELPNTVRKLTSDTNVGLQRVKKRSRHRHVCISQSY
jgi:hypothetical protein